MTTSTTSTFNLSAQDLITLSLVDVGAGGPAFVDPALFPHALKVLNVVAKSLDTKGTFTWNVPRRIVTLTGGQSSYVLPNDAYDIDQPARYTQAGATYGSQVQAMSRDEYMSLPDRTIQGTPYQYFSDKGLDATGIYQVTFYLYPVPPNTGDTLEIATQTKSNDVTDLSQTLDISQKWLDAIRWSLTVALCPAYNVPIPTQSYYRSMAKEKVDEALEDDGERGDVQIVPFGQQVYGRGSGWGAY